MLSRRALLRRAATGFGMVAAHALLGAGSATVTPLPSHARGRARNVIFLYMEGGVSQVDSFDHKPMLARHHGKNPREVMGKLEKTQFESIGTVFKSPWEFRQRGESGLWVSDLFPHIAQCADELCVVRSMTSAFPEHTSANYFLHSGLGLQGRPSMGAWVAYGLGSENHDMPGYVVLNGGQIPPDGGKSLWGSAFLPGQHQGVRFRSQGDPVLYLSNPPGMDDPTRRRMLDATGALNALAADSFGDPEIDARIAQYEMAFRMQASVPELTDLKGESAATLEAYGVRPDAKDGGFARNCLLARRMIERGVRFVQVSHGPVQPWDSHDDLEISHRRLAGQVDKAIAALIADLKRLGLFEETLILWGGEFGRTPVVELPTPGSNAGKINGRDHNNHGFTMWVAGGGTKGGYVHGATDEFGFQSVEKVVHVHDLHATLLHLLGFDHEKFTYRYAGRDFRLTDIHGRVLQEILA